MRLRPRGRCRFVRHRVDLESHGLARALVRGVHPPAVGNLLNDEQPATAFIAGVDDLGELGSPTAIVRHLDPQPVATWSDPDGDRPGPMEHGVGDHFTSSQHDVVKLSGRQSRQKRPQLPAQDTRRCGLGREDPDLWGRCTGFCVGTPFLDPSVPLRSSHRDPLSDRNCALPNCRAGAWSGPAQVSPRSSCTRRTAATLQKVRFAPTVSTSWPAALTAAAKAASRRTAAVSAKTSWLRQAAGTGPPHAESSPGLRRAGRAC